MTARRILEACLTVTLLGMTAAGAAAQAGATQAGKGKPVEYAAGYTSYFVKNNAPVKTDFAYLVLTSKEEFDRVFGIGFTMKKAKVIDPKAFDTKTAVAVIKQGNAPWTYQVQDATVADDTLRVSYRATEGDAGSARFASPLIVLADGKAYARVIFVENGKEVATVRVPKAK